MKVTCPKCGFINQTLPVVQGVFRCASCGEWFEWFPPPSQPLPKILPAEPKASFNAAAPAREPEPEPARDLSEAKKIRISALGLEIGAGLFALAAFLVAFQALYTMVAGEDAGSGFIIAGGLLCVAGWLYHVAQIVHIRALLAKNSPP